MTSANEDEEATLAGELVQVGGEFAGAAVGGGIGLIGGPVGVVAGAAGGVAASRTFKKVGAMVRKRWLDPREEARAGGALALAVEKVGLLMQSGAQFRNDGFFDAAGDQRPTAEELLEGTL